MEKYKDRCDPWKDQGVLCFNYTPMFSDTLVFNCSERTKEGLVEVTFSTLLIKCLSST